MRPTRHPPRGHPMSRQTVRPPPANSRERFCSRQSWTRRTSRMSLPHRCEATTLERMSLDQLARAADTVVRARCVSTSARWENGAIWTFSEFDLVERFKGNPPERIRVRVPGGRVGHISTRVEAGAAIPPRRRCRALPRSSCRWQLRCDRLGRRHVSHSESFRFLLGHSSRRIPAALAVFDPATRQFRSEGTRNLPWSEFRRRLVDARCRSRAPEACRDAIAKKDKAACSRFPRRRCFCFTWRCPSRR